MTVTSTQPTPPDPQPSFSDSLNTVLKTAPELAQSPGLAVGVAASGGDTQVRAQSVARGAQTISDQRATNQVAQSAGSSSELSTALNWFGNHIDHAVTNVAHDVIQGAEQQGSAVMGTLNKPLQVVQHEYRYLHDVEATHGMGAAALEGLGIAAGAAGGFALAGPQGAVLGGEAATALESQVFYRDSWERTASASYADPHTHQPVSIGRDVTSLLGLSRGTLPFKVTSGLIDGIADIGLDPLAKGGNLVGEAKSAEGASAKLGQFFSGIAPVNAEDIDRVYQQYGSVRRAFADIAGKTAGEIAATPAYDSIARQTDLVRELGKTNTADDVAQVFKDVFRTHEMAFTEKLPTLSITRQPFQNLREYAENAGGPVGSLARNVTRLPDSFDSATKEFTGKDFDPSDPLDNGAVGLYRMLRFTEDRRTAASIVDTYINAPDLASRVRIVNNAKLSTLFNAAGFRGVSTSDYLQQFSSDPAVRTAMGRALADAVSGGMFGKDAVYGLDDQGRNLSLVRDVDGSWQYGAGITMNQTGRLDYLNLADVRRAAKTMQGARELFTGQSGRLDRLGAAIVHPIKNDTTGQIGDYAYDKITQGFFKPLVLLTPSYAMHISLAELIPNMIRSGVGNIVKSGIGINVARLGEKMTGPDDPSALTGLAWKLVTAGRKALPNRIDAGLEKRLEIAARYIEANDGHLVAAGLSSGHSYASEVASREENSVNLMRRAYADSPQKTSSTFGIFGQGHEQYVTAWQSWLRELSNDDATKVAARSLLEQSRSGGVIEDGSRVADEALSDSEIANLRSGRGIDRVLHRETDARGATELVNGGETQGTAGGRRYDFATNRHLALGQGDNQGVHVEYDGGDVQHALNDSKPVGPEISRTAELLGSLKRGVHPRSVTIDRSVSDEPYVDATHAWRQHRSDLESALRRDGYRPFPDANGAVRWVRSDLASRGAVSIETASGNAAKEVAAHIRALPANERDRMMRSLDQFTGFGLPNTALEGMDRPPDMDAIDEWSRVIVANLRGATRGADRSMNIPLLDHVANKTESVPTHQLEDVPEPQRPINVKGREIVPDGSSSVQRIADVGFRKILNPMVNFLSRQPIAFAEFERQWAFEEPKIAAGLVDEDEAMTRVMSRTVNNVIRNVHNLHDRTQWTVTARNWMPFFFAQEQAYRRMGRMLAENPGAFRKYQLMISNIHDVGQVFGGANGQGYFVIPGTGFLTSRVAQAASMIGLPVNGSSPVGMGWNLSSSSVIFPLSSGVRPDLGPLVAIPTSAIAQLFPETLSPVLKSDITAAATGILGPTASESLYSQMVPNTIVQRLLTAAYPSFNERSFDSTMMQVLQTMQYEGKVPPPTANAWQMQTFLDRVRNQTRIMYAMKAIVGAATPVSPEVTVPLHNMFNTELTNDINQQKSVNKGITEFLSKHPDASPFTVFQSSNEQGTSVPSSVQAENWIDGNLPLIRQYGAAALLLMPPNTDTTYNAAVYNEQIAQGLRTKWFPGGIEPNSELSGYLSQLYINAGNSVVLNKWYPQYEKSLQGLTGEAKYQAEQNWQNTLTQYAKQNPIWGTYWNSDNKATQRGQAIQNMRTLLASPEAPKTEIAKQAGALLSAYDAYQNQLSVGTADGFVGQSQSQINQQWKDNLYATVAQHPEVANLVTGLFLSLPDTTKQIPTSNGTSAPGVFQARSYNAA